MLASPDLTPHTGVAVRVGSVPGLGLDSGLQQGFDSCPSPSVLLIARLLASLVPGQPEPWTCAPLPGCPARTSPTNPEHSSPALRLLTSSADAFSPARVALAALRMVGAAGDSTLAPSQHCGATAAVRALAGAAAAAAARVAHAHERRALAAVALQGGNLARARAALRADGGLRQAVSRAMVLAMNRIVAGVDRCVSCRIRHNRACSATWRLGTLARDLLLC